MGLLSETVNHKSRNEGIFFMGPEPSARAVRRQRAEGKYKGRKPTARAKAADAVRLFEQGKHVSYIAKELGVGRGSV
jgi:DNA invertase Pin-like site-specific DNA recombinase